MTLLLRWGRVSPLLLLWLTMLFITFTSATNLTLPFPPRTSSSPYTPTRDASFFFNIISPDPLAGALTNQPAMFGTHWPITGWKNNVPYFSGEVVLPHIQDDILLCASDLQTVNEFNDTFTGKVLLVRRGSCAFGIKAKRAQLAGAAAMIIYGCPTTPPTNCAPGLQTSIIAVNNVSIPLAFIQAVDGELLNSYLLQRNRLRNETQTTNVTIIGEPVMMETITTGPLDANERVSLTQIVNVTTMNQDTITTMSGNLRPWNNLTIGDPTKDPCLDRLAGIWCENGHIVKLFLPNMAWQNIIDGTLPIGLGALTMMRSFSIANNLFSGPIPLELCSWTEAFDLDLRIQRSGKLDGLTSIPSCFSSFTKLTSFVMNNNALSQIPDFLNCTQLTTIDISNNQITSLPASFPNWHQLVFFWAGSNRLTTLPVLSGLTALDTFSIPDNLIEAEVSADIFDGLSSITTLDISINRLSGPLPNLIGCGLLTSLTITDNAFSSSIPPSWRTNIPNLLSFRASHNQIISPIITLGRLLNLQVIDLSWNNITANTGTPEQLHDVGALLSQTSGPSLITLNLGHNQLNGRWTSGWLQLAISLRQIYINDNQITQLPVDLFSLPFTSLDASNNQLSIWGATARPSDSFNYLNLRNNPALVPDPIPFWMVPSSNREMVTSPLDEYSCPRLVSSTNPLMQVQVDAIFTNYNGCRCVFGTFGLPPLCYAVPFTATLDRGGGLASPEVGPNFVELVALTSGRFVENKTQSTRQHPPDMSFEDGWYGDTRLTSGIQTSFVIDFSSNSTANAPIRYITVCIHLNRDLFTHVTDVITIYEGDSSLSSTRVAALRGTDDLPAANSSAFTSTPEYLATYGTRLAAIKNVSLWEIDVLGTKATVSFTSRDSSGTHFFATYSGSTDCPPDYFYDGNVDRCRPNLEVFHVSVGIRLGVLLMGVLSATVVVFTFFAILFYFDEPVIRASSRPFLVLVLAFLLLMSLGSLLYAAVPDESSIGRAICNGRVWLAAWPLTGVLAVLLAKSNRISNIFSSTKFQVRKVPDTELLMVVLAMLAISTIFLGIYSGVPLNEPRVEEGSGEYAGKLVSYCRNLSGFGPWISIMLVYIFMLMIGASYLAFKTRDVPSRFNESTHMMNALFLLLFFGALIVPLDFFIQDNPNAAVLIQGIGQSLMGLLLTGVIFFPKIYIVYVVNNITASTVASASAKTGDSSSFSEISALGEQLGYRHPAVIQAMKQAAGAGATKGQILGVQQLPARLPAGSRGRTPTPTPKEMTRMGAAEEAERKPRAVPTRVNLTAMINGKLPSNDNSVSSSIPRSGIDTAATLADILHHHFSVQLANLDTSWMTPPILEQYRQHQLHSRSFAIFLQDAVAQSQQPLLKSGDDTTPTPPRTPDPTPVVTKGDSKAPSNAAPHLPHELSPPFEIQYQDIHLVVKTPTNQPNVRRLQQKPESPPVHHRQHQQKQLLVPPSSTIVHTTISSSPPSTSSSSTSSPLLSPTAATITRSPNEETSPSRGSGSASASASASPSTSVTGRNTPTNLSPPASAHDTPVSSIRTILSPRSQRLVRIHQTISPPAAAATTSMTAPPSSSSSFAS